MRLLVCGIDGLSPHALSEHRRVMPTIGGFEHRADVRTDVALSRAAWVSMATGLRPGRHGVGKAGAVGGWERDDIEADGLLYQVLNEYGYSVGWCRVPVSSHPPTAIDGWMAGDGPSPPTVWPQRLANLYDPGPSAVAALKGVAVGNEEPERVAACHQALWPAARQALHAELSSALRLISAEPVDVLFCYFGLTSAIQHHCLHDAGTMRAMHDWVDRAVRTLIEACDPADTIVVSDHGMRRVRADDFEARKVDGTWMIRAERGRTASYHSGARRSPGVVVSTFDVADAIYPEDVFAWACRRCGIPDDELVGLDCHPGCCEPGDEADGIERQLRALGYI